MVPPRSAFGAPPRGGAAGGRAKPGHGGRWVVVALLLLVLSAGSFARGSLFALQEPWLDEHGRGVKLAQWRGKPTIVAMEYSACRFVCSVYWRRLQQIQAEADRRGLDLQFVILSIDPQNDSPAAWRDYRRQRDLVRTNWHFLTGSREQTTRAAALLGVKWWYFDGHLMHDFKVVRLSAEGSIGAAMTSYDEPLDVVLARP